MNGNQTGADNTAAPGKKIDRETAEAEFNLFCDNNRIEREESAMNDDEKKSFKEHKRRFVLACMDGRAEVDGTSVKYKISDFSPEGFKGEIVIAKRPGGNAFSAMDGYKEEQSVHKLLGFFSAMTGKDTKYFSKIDIIDWKFFDSVSALFLSL